MNYTVVVKQKSDGNYAMFGSEARPLPLLANLAKTYFRYKVFAILCFVPKIGANIELEFVKKQIFNFL